MVPAAENAVCEVPNAEIDTVAFVAKPVPVRLTTAPGVTLVGEATSAAPPMLELLSVPLSTFPLALPCR